MKLEAFIAFRYLRAKRKQTFMSLITLLSMLGVGLGVCTLIVVLSVMSGFEKELKSKILGLNANVMIFGAGIPVEKPEAAMKIVTRDPQVRGASPFVYGQVMIVSGGGASGAVLKGVKLPEVNQVLDLEGIWRRGKVSDLARPGPGGLPGVALGRGLARQLGVMVGSVVNLVNPLGEDTPVGRVPKSEPFRVVGLFESGMYQYDTSMAYVDLAAAQELFDLGSGVTGIEVKIADIYQAGQVGSRLVKALGRDYYARDWMTMNHSLFAALKLERVTMFVILILIVLVAAFGIISSLVMLVMEKTRDIAVLKAMGASSRVIRKIFVLQGFIIGAVGTVFGIGLGLVLCLLLARYKFIELPADVYPLSTLPVDVQPLTVAAVALAAVAICLIATIYPARAAGALKPAEALRYE